MPRFLAPLLLASFALGATAPASAQDGPDEPLVLLMVSRTDAVDETAVVDALGREGVQAVTLEHPRAPYLDAIVLLVEEDGRRALPMTTFAHVRICSTAHNERHHTGSLA